MSKIRKNYNPVQLLGRLLLKIDFSLFWVLLERQISGLPIGKLRSRISNLGQASLLLLSSVFFTAIVKLVNRNLVSIIASRIKHYTIIFKAIEAVLSLITWKNSILLLPIYEILQSLRINLGISSTNGYLKLLANTKNTIKVSVAIISSMLIKSLWVNINLLSYEIPPYLITYISMSNNIDVNKIVKANKIYRSIVTLVYQLNRTASLFNLLLTRTSSNPEFRLPKKVILNIVRLFELSVLDLLDVIGVYGVKPAILLTQLYTPKQGTKSVAHQPKITHVVNGKLGYHNLRNNLSYKLPISSLSINVTSLVSYKIISLLNSKIGTLTPSHSDKTYLRYKISPSVYRRVNKYFHNILNTHRIFRILKKKKFQELPYNKLIQVDQFDKQYQNTLRVGESYPTSNYSNTMLMEFYRIYGYVLLRAMISQEVSKDSRYHIRHEITSTAFRSYHHLPTLKDIVFETTIEYKTRRLLSEMYQHYVYRKSTFILVPKNVERVSGSLNRIYYYFYRDLTENLFPYFRLRLERYRDHPALFEGFSGEITNYYSTERKQKSVSIGETGTRINNFKFYPIYWFYFDPDDYNTSLVYKMDISHNYRFLKHGGVSSPQITNKPRYSYTNLRASSILNMSWYLNRLLNRSTLQREEFESLLNEGDPFIPNSTIKPSYFKG